MRNLAGLYFFLLLLAACSGHRNESELHNGPLAFTGHFKVLPGEELRYRAFMGPFRLGDLQIKVSEKPDTIRGNPAWCIRADGKSASGLSWLSEVEHHWESWIDTASGLSLRTNREARENRYRVKEEIQYFPDSSLIITHNLRKNQLRRFHARPAGMQDLLNLTWKLRFTDFEKFKPGDTLRYVGFHDNEWLAFSVCLAGKTYLGKGKNRKETWEIFPIGLATSFLRGDNPARLWIETSARRRPVMAKLETYFGNFRVDLLD